MKKILIAITVLMLTACAGMGGNEAYSEAHKAASARGIAEANASAKANETIALAIASAAKGCETDACRMGAMMSYASIKAQIDGVAKSVAPVIQAPVNEALEIGKLAAQTFLGGYGLRIGLAKFGIDAMRGSSDKDTTREAFQLGDIYRADK